MEDTRKQRVEVKERLLDLEQKLLLHMRAQDHLLLIGLEHTPTEVRATALTTETLLLQNRQQIEHLAILEIRLALEVPSLLQVQEDQFLANQELLKLHLAELEVVQL